MEEIVLEESTLKYRRPDIEGGYIYDKDEIDYYRATQRNDVLDNLLLGDFNMVGAYVINNAIVEELIKLTKVYTDTFGKSIFCDSLKKFGKDVLHFRLNIIKGEPSEHKVTASLEILETIDRANGYYQNTNTCLVDSHIFDDGKNVEEKIFKFYNILANTDKGAEKIENDYEVPNILHRQAELERLNKMCLPTSARFEKELFEKRIRALSSNFKSRNILEEFNRQVFHIKDDLLDKHNPRYFRHLNQILDGILQQYGFEIAGEKQLLKDLSLFQVEYANKQFKQEAVRNNEIVRQDNKEFRKYFNQETTKQQNEVDKKQDEKLTNNTNTLNPAKTQNTITPVKIASVKTTNTFSPVRTSNKITPAKTTNTITPVKISNQPVSSGQNKSILESISKEQNNLTHKSSQKFLNSINHEEENLQETEQMENINA